MALGVGWTTRGSTAGLRQSAAAAVVDVASRRAVEGSRLSPLEVFSERYLCCTTEKLQARERERKLGSAMAQQQQQLQQSAVPSRPSSPPMSISPPPGQPLVGGSGSLQNLQHEAQAALTGMMSQARDAPRRASTACDGDQTTAAVARSGGMRKVREVDGKPSSRECRHA